MEKIVRDPEIDDLLKEEKDTARSLKMAIEKLETQMDEYKNEAKIVLGIVAKFIVFLKENAMISSTDPFENYLRNVVEE